MLRVLVVLAVEGSAPVHAAELTRQQMGCLNAASLAQAGQTGGAAACVTRCATRGGRSVGDALTQCYPPYDSKGGRAVDDCVVASRERVVAFQRAKCAGAACPRCYGGDCAAEAPAQMAQTAALVEYYVPILFCDDSQSPDGLAGGEWSCMRATGVQTGKLARALIKCYNKCTRRAVGDALLVSACDPPATDRATLACLDRVQAKAASAMESACTDRPDCYGPGVDGAFWAKATRDAIDGYPGPAPKCRLPR